MRCYYIGRLSLSISGRREMNAEDLTSYEVFEDYIDDTCDQFCIAVALFAPSGPGLVNSAARLARGLSSFSAFSSVVYR